MTLTFTLTARKKIYLVNLLKIIIINQNEALLAQQVAGSVAVNRAADPRGLFLILPTDGASYFLIKAIVTGELMLPCTLSTNTEPASSDQLQAMETSLDQVSFSQ